MKPVVFKSRSYLPDTWVCVHSDLYVTFHRKGFRRAINAAIYEKRRWKTPSRKRFATLLTLLAEEIRAKNTF